MADEGYKRAGRGRQAALDQADLTGSFCTKRFDRNWLGKELGYGEEETHPGADCDAAAADRGGDVTRQIGIDRVPGSGNRGSELRDELPNGEIFYSLKEAKVLIEQWRQHYNTVRPHSSLGYRPPAPQTVAPLMHHLDQKTAM